MKTARISGSFLGLGAAMLMTGTTQAAQAIPLVNSDFESPTWVNNGTYQNPVWSLQTVPDGALAPNYNIIDPRFGVQGWAKTAVDCYAWAGVSLTNGSVGDNGEGAYSERNNSTTPAGQFYKYVNGSLPAPANGHNFFSIQPSGFKSSYAPIVNAAYSDNWSNVWNGQNSSVDGYRYNYTPGSSQLPMMYNFWIDQQPTYNNLPHTDVNYPPMIPASTTIAGHTYTATVALGNPIWNQTNGNPAFPVVELSFTNNAFGDSGNYNGYGTTVARAWANGSSDPNWMIAPGTFKDLSVTWTAPTSGLPLNIQLNITGFTQTPGTSQANMVSMDNVRLVDETAVPEPASLTLLVMGLLGVGCGGRRRLA